MLEEKIMRTRFTASVAALAILTLTGMAWANPEMAQQAQQAAATQAATAPATPPATTPAVEQAPAGHPAMPQAEPKPSPAAAPAEKMVPISGKVVQTISSGGYAYALVKQKDGKKIWVAIPEMKVTVGEEVSFEPGMEMTNFQSTTLKRTFDKIIFSSGPTAAKKGKDGKSAKKDDQKSTTRGSAGAVVAVADEKVKVKKATGANAYTVAEIFKNKDKLKNKKVTVNGKVVKVSSGIMSRNWIHIQDGTGSHQTGDNDLVVTADAIPLVGDVITIKGIMLKDKDFGSGYKYNVMVEKAEVIIQ
jgi:hypothetical protein